MALLHGLLSPLRQFVCLVPDAAQQVHAPRFISLLFVKRSRTLCGYSMAFTWETEEMCFLGKSKILQHGNVVERRVDLPFSSVAGGWGQKLHLWHPAKWVSSFTWHNSLLPLFASPEFKFLWFGVLQGVGLVWSLSIPIKSHTELIVKLWPELNWHTLKLPPKVVLNM